MPSGEELALVVALEAGPRHDIEDSVGAVAISGGIAAALHFEVIDILGIDLWPNVAGDIGIGDRHAIDGPRHLVPAAHVQLIVGDLGAGNVVGDHGQAVAARMHLGSARYRGGLSG